MLSYFRRKRVGPIGCAFEEDAVYLAQIRNARLITAQAVLGSSEVTSRGARAGAVRVAYESGLFEGSDVVACAPLNLTSFRRMSIAPMPDTDCGKVVHWQTARELSLPPEEVCAGYYESSSLSDPASPSGRRRDLVAVAVGAGLLSEFLMPIQSAQLRPIAVDTEPGVLARCLTLSDPESPGQFIVVLRDSKSLIFTAHQGQPSFIHPMVPQGWRENATKSDAAERSQLVSELVRQIRMCQHYLLERHASHLVPAFGCIVGAGPFEAEIAEQLNAQSDVRFAPLAESLVPGLKQLIAFLPPDNSIEEWLPAMGLALYGREEICRGAA